MFSWTHTQTRTPSLTNTHTLFLSLSLSHSHTRGSCSPNVSSRHSSPDGWAWPRAGQTNIFWSVIHKFHFAQTNIGELENVRRVFFPPSSSSWQAPRVAPTLGQPGTKIAASFDCQPPSHKLTNLLPLATTQWWLTKLMACSESSSDATAHQSESSHNWSIYKLPNIVVDKSHVTNICAIAKILNKTNKTNYVITI